MKQKIYLLIVFLSFFNSMKAQESNFLEILLRNRKDLFDTILKNPAKYRLQIVYTQINRDKNNKPSFKTFKYRADKNEYFYPASTVKLPVALLALEKINKLKISGLNKHSRMRIDSVRKPQTPVWEDSTSQTGYPSIAHYIHKIFVASDNDSYNRLFEFLGQRAINEALWKKGYKDVQILHRLSAWGFDEKSNRYTNPIKFYNARGLVYQQAEAVNKTPFKPKIKDTKIGQAQIVYEDGEKKRIEKPMYVGDKNYFSLETMQEILKAVIFPEITPTEKKFLLSEDDYELLLNSMSMLPSESIYPSYKGKEHKDNFVKFLMFGDKKSKIPPHIRVFNKVGLSYGFITDNAYIVDFENQIEFLLSATLYVNEDETLNDDKYEYKLIGLPFMERLGRVIYWYEKNRTRKHKPNLDKFMLKYKQ